MMQKQTIKHTVNNSPKAQLVFIGTALSIKKKSLDNLLSTLPIGLVS